jgi:hypothetical protein
MKKAMNSGLTAITPASYLQGDPARVYSEPGIVERGECARTLPEALQGRDVRHPTLASA